MYNTDLQQNASTSFTSPKLIHVSTMRGYDLSMTPPTGYRIVLNSNNDATMPQTRSFWYSNIRDPESQLLWEIQYRNRSANPLLYFTTSFPREETRSWQSNLVVCIGFCSIRSHSKAHLHALKSLETTRKVMATKKTGTNYSGTRKNNSSPSHCKERRLSLSNLREECGYICRYYLETAPARHNDVVTGSIVASSSVEFSR